MTESKSSWMGWPHRYHPPGTAPGTLVDYHRDDKKALAISITVYNIDNYQHYQLSSLGEAWQYEKPGAITWLTLNGTTGSDVLQELGEHYTLHPLALEDVMNQGQHPKLEDYPGHHFLTAYLLASGGQADAYQVSFFTGADFIITLVPSEANVFELVQKRLQSPQSALRRQGVDYLVYNLIDSLVDRFFPRLESINEELGLLEDGILSGKGNNLIERVHNIKMVLVVLEKLVWGLRELVGAMQNEDSGFASPHTRFYLRDCYDHTEQLLHTIESYREISSGLMETYLSLNSNQMNQVMKVLTLIATIFIPLTFIVGVYGMNFNPHAGPLSMPELNWPYGYAAVWALMLAIAVAMLWVFKRRKWF